MNSELREELSAIVGRRLHTYELVDALGISRSAYYLQRDEDRLVSADNLLRLAVALGINPVELLLRYGLINGDEILDAAAAIGNLKRNERRTGRRRKLTPRADAPPV